MTDEAKPSPQPSGASKRIVTVRVLQQLIIRALLELNMTAELNNELRERLEQALRGKF